MAMIVILVGPLLVLAWHMTENPNWMPETPRFRGRGAVYALIFWAFFVLFLKMPIWIRLPTLAVAGFQIIRLSARRVVHAFDRQPDFSIGPNGIGGLDQTGFQIIPWQAIGSVTVQGPTVEITGQPHGPRRFFDTLPPRRIRIVFSQLIFSNLRKADLLDAIRFFRPDIEIREIEMRYWRW